MFLPIRRLVPRFRLRTLLVAVAIIGVGCAWVGDRYMRGRREHAAVDALRRGGIVLIGYDYEYDITRKYKGFGVGKPNAPRWLRQILGEEFFSHVVNVTTDPLEGASVFTNLKDLPDLQVLVLRGKRRYNGPARYNSPPGYVDKLNDSSIAFLSKLSGLKQLKSLSIEDCTVTDRGLAHLDGLPYLEELTLSATDCSGSGLMFLPTPERLKNLRIVGQTNDDAMAVLGRLRGLESLDIYMEHVGTATMRRISNLKELRFLSLTGAPTGDEQLRCVARMKNLEVLQLDIWSATDDGVNKLAAMKKLSHLYASCTKATVRALQSLHEFMPQTKIALTIEPDKAPK